MSQETHSSVLFIESLRKILLGYTELPGRVLLGNHPYKIAVPSFYFTAVTVRRGTTMVDGVQNFPAYFRYEFFSETRIHRS